MSDAAGCILVPGNHRIRLLWPEAGRSVVILKAGFSKRYISAEVNLRETYAAGLAPALAEVAPDGLSFVEEYVEGTPINRLPPAVEQRLRSEALARLRDKVVMPTIRRERAGTWASTLECSIAQILAATGQSLTEWWRSEFLSLARRVVSVICECGPDSEIYTAMTHGDFQAGNILADGKRLWVIDWECADRRLASYDLLCLAWNVRLSSDWIGHVGDDGADDGWRDQVADWLGVDVIEVPRRLHAAFFVLEELRFSIGDAFDPNFRSRSARAESILARFREVVVQLERRHD